MSSFGSTYELRELNEEVRKLKSEAKETNRLLGEIVKLLKRDEVTINDNVNLPIVDFLIDKE